LVDSDLSRRERSKGGWLIVSYRGQFLDALLRQGGEKAEQVQQRVSREVGVCLQRPAHVTFSPMSMVTIEVKIDHGQVTPVAPNLLPEHGRALLTVLTTRPGNGTAFHVESEADGLPVIRAKGGAITSALVQEIEGFAG
jgi:hypothetical protein